MGNGWIATSASTIEDVVGIGTDLIELSDNAGNVFDAKPEEIRKSTRERYLLGTLKKALNIEF